MFKIKNILGLVLAMCAFKLSNAACPNLNLSFVVPPQVGCGVPQNFIFDNTSTGTNANNTSYIWKIDGVRVDSTRGTVTNFNYTFSGPGTFIVRMVAITPGNCRDSIQQSVTITSGAPLVYDGNLALTFTPRWTNCIINPLQSDNYNISLSSNVILNNYTIIWGDGTANATGVSLPVGNILNHTYTTLGLFNIKIVTVNSGCSDTINGTVINMRPVSTSIKPLPAGQLAGCAPHTITFQDTTQNALPGTILTWNFGDGTIITRNWTQANQPISHTYLPTGNGNCIFTVSLSAFNPNCNTGTTNASVFTISPILIFDKDVAQINPPSNLCQPSLTYTFGNSSQDNCITGQRYYYWSFGDGTNTGWITTKNAQTHTFPSLGPYTIMLIDSNACGSDTTFTTVTINAPPVVGFVMSPKFGCAPLSVTFTDTSLGTGNTRFWTLPGTTPNSSTLQTLSRTFNNPGTYVIRLSVSNACANNIIVRDTLRVFAKPNVSIGNATSGCVPHTIQVQNNTTNQGPNATYFWDFGNGQTSTLRVPPPITYNTTGSFPIKLVVTDTCGKDSQIVTIAVSTLPNAQFTATDVCRGTATTFTSSSTVAPGDVITNYKWIYGNGDSTNSGTAVQNFTYPASGTFNAILQIRTDKTCIGRDTVVVSVRSSPIISFASTPSTICDGALVSFNGTATTAAPATISAYRWTFGTGDTARVEDTVYRFPTPGTYNIVYSVSNNAGCTTNTNSNITVHPVPDARLFKTLACRGQRTFFSDSSIVGFGNTIAQWAWDFDNNGITDSTTQHPSFIFPNLGTFKTKLTVTTNNGCSNTDSINTIVNATPTAAATSNAAALCKGDSFSFTNNSLGAFAYSWTFGDGSGDFFVTSTAPYPYAYNDTGQFNVKLIAYSLQGCRDSTTVPVISRPLPDASFTVNDTIGCAPKLFTFNNTSILSNGYKWLVGSATQTSTLTNRPDTLIALSGQVVPIRLIATNQFNCKPDTAVRTLYTFGNPTPNFTSSADSGCGPLTVNFTNTTPDGSSYIWRLGNGNTANTTNSSTVYLPSQQNDSTYQIKLIANNIAGCKDSITKTIRVFPQPISAFTHATTNGCGPLSVAFVNTSNHKFGGNLSNMTFNWNFGNNTSSTLQSPAGLFLSSATKDTTYNVRLISFSRFGCSDTSTSSVRVYPKAKAAFTVNSPAGCGPHTTTFTNNSIPNDTGAIGIMTFAWRFANGLTSTTVNPQATYTASQTVDSVYAPRLIAFSEHGCADTTFGTVRVYPNPKSVFTPSVSSGCGPLNVTFTNQSFPNDTGTINNMTFLWNYGNGFSDVTQNGASQFTARLLADTPYTIRLTAFSEHGCIDTTTRKITVRPNPVTAFSTNKTAGCGPLQVQFTNNTQLGFNYYWNFGDGDTSSSLNPSHTFTSFQIFDSIYEVKLASQSVYGCLGDTVKTTIIARYDPIADFFPSSDSICGGGSIAFFNSSLGGTVNQWNFGNGQSSVAINPVANFIGLPTKDTTYTVRLISTSPYGCKDTLFKPIKINPLPDAQFTNVPASCHPYPVTFNNTSLRAVKYEWDFGDATFDTINSNASKLFTNTFNLITRVYPVTLTAKSASGCIDTAKRNISVYPLPVAAFSPNLPSGCGPLTTSFINSSIPSDTTIATFAWRFGNGLQSTLKNPVTTFVPSASVDSLYTPRLITTNQFGCKDTSYQTVRIFPKPKAIFTPSTNAGCGPLDVTFNNVSIPNDTGTINDMNFIWQYGNGQSSTTKNGATQFLARNLVDTIYTVKLIAYSEHGCVDTAQSQVTLRAKPVTAFVPDKISGCSPLSVLFTNTSQVGNTYHWSFGTGDTSNAINATHTFSTNQLFDSSYLVKLVAKSAFGCIGDTVNRTITARYIPIANFTPSRDSICGSGNISFNNTSIGGLQNNWVFGNGLVSTAINPVANFTASLTKDTTYQTKLIITTTNGCKDSIFKPIKVNALPEALFANVLPGCTPYQVSFNNISLRGAKYEWDFGDGTKDTTSNANKSFTNNLVLVNRTYPVTLTAKSTSGCIDTAIRNITVYPLPDVSISPLKSLRCDTAEYNFLNATQGASNYLWRFGDGNTSTLQSPTHYYRTNPSTNITYNVKMIATSGNGCRDSAADVITVRPLVIADFIASATSSCLNLDVQFQNFSRNAINYFWLFGDGAGNNSITPQHKYSSTGTFDVTLIAYDQFGCSDTAVKPNSIKIYEIPKALFSYNPVDPQLPNPLVNFTNLSTITNGTLTSEWNFGDFLNSSNTSTLNNPSHNYSDSGNFNPRLVVTSNQGCKDTFDRTLRVDPRKPIPAFDCDPKSGCKPLTVTFTNQSLYAYTYRWDFGDGTKSNEVNPIHTYTRADSFNVELTAYGPGGDSTIEKRKLIAVHDLPRARFSANPTSIFLPEAYSTFTNTSFDAVKTFWTVIDDDNNVIFSDTNYNSGFEFTNEGLHSVRLVVLNQFGCPDTSTGINIINVDRSGTIFVPNAFSPNGDNANEVFLPVVTGVRQQGYELRIYDRWGRLVFKTDDPSKGWDGKIYGSPALTDVYVWLVEGTFVTNERFVREGSVTLLR